MPKSIERVIRDYVSLLREEGVPVREVRLFGSRARRRGHRWSDIDLCVISPQFGRNYWKEGVRLRILSSRVDSPWPIEPIPFHPRDLKKKYSTLASEIRKYGKKIRV